MNTTLQQQDSILYQLAADLMAVAASDADRARIDRALDLVDHTERVANVPGLWLVYSQSDDSKAYTVDATTCSCPDFQKRGGWCKHRTAVKLAQMVERAEVDQEQADAAIDADAPIGLELTGRGYLALVPPTALPPSETGCTRLPMSARARAFYDDLYPDGVA